MTSSGIVCPKWGNRGDTPKISSSTGFVRKIVCVREWEDYKNDLLIVPTFSLSPVNLL